MPTVQEVKFKRKTTTEIDNLEIEDGALIYNVDNGKTYMDYGNERIQTGGNADTMIYVGDEEPTDEDIKLWIETPTSETKASEIVDEYTESNKVGYSTSFVNATVLYNDSTGTNGNITLSDSVENYRYIEIYFYKSSSYYNNPCKFIKLYNPNGKNALLDTFIYNTTTSPSELLFNTKIIQINNNSITNVQYEQYTIKDSSTWTPFGSNANGIYITTVLGYK